MVFGFFEGPTFRPDRDIPDLTDKIIIVTGGNAGLGKSTIQELAKHNPGQIYLAARTPAKAESAISDIKHVVPGARIQFLELDLTSLQSVKQAADSFKSQSRRLDVLINNAGIMAVPPALTKEGYEIQFGTNHVGHALFTKLLLPTLEKTAAQPGADVRIVDLTSGGHRLAPAPGFDPDFVRTDMASYSTWRRYGVSKLANILFTVELAKRYPAIKCAAVHPGGVATNLSDTFFGSAPWYLKTPLGVLKPLVPYLTSSPEQGALTQLWAATGKDVESGKYYEPVAVQKPGSTYAQDEKLAEKLWDWTEAELAKHGY